MAVYSLISPTCWVGQQDLSGDLHTLNGTVTQTILDTTTFTSGGWHTRIAGLHDIDLQGDGYLNLGTGNVEEFLYTTSLGTVNVVTLGLTDGTVDGNPAALFRALHTNIDYPQKVGDVAQFKATFKGSAQEVRGNLLTSKAAQNTNGTLGTVVTVGATATTSKLYATLHVFAVSGTNPTMQVSVLSGTTSGFGASTSRIAFATVTGTGAVWATPVTGPITDTFYRTQFTLGGTSNPSFTLGVAVGIL